MHTITERSHTPWQVASPATLALLVLVPLTAAPAPRRWRFPPSGIAGGRGGVGGEV